MLVTKKPFIISALKLVEGKVVSIEGNKFFYDENRPYLIAVINEPVQQVSKDTLISICGVNALAKFGADWTRFVVEDSTIYEASKNEADKMYNISNPATGEYSSCTEKEFKLKFFVLQEPDTLNTQVTLNHSEVVALCIDKLRTLAPDFDVVEEEDGKYTLAHVVYTPTHERAATVSFGPCLDLEHEFTLMYEDGVHNFCVNTNNPLTELDRVINNIAAIRASAKPNSAWAMFIRYASLALTRGSVYPIIMREITPGFVYFYCPATQEEMRVMCLPLSDKHIVVATQERDFTFDIASAQAATKSSIIADFVEFITRELYADAYYTADNVICNLDKLVQDLETVYHYKANANRRKDSLGNYVFTCESYKSFYFVPTGNSVKVYIKNTVGSKYELLCECDSITRDTLDRVWSYYAL